MVKYRSKNLYYSFLSSKDEFYIKYKNYTVLFYNTNLVEMNRLVNNKPLLRNVLKNVAIANFKNLVDCLAHDYKDFK